MCSLYKPSCNFLGWGVRGVTSPPPTPVIASPREITLMVVGFYLPGSQGTTSSDSWTLKGDLTISTSQSRTHTQERLSELPMVAQPGSALPRLYLRSYL